MKKLITGFLLLFTLSSIAQNFQPNWESLDKRVTPQWWKDAKFGIFIHWGMYAVPGWSVKGNYSEWYQQGLQTTDTARQRFHRAKFGDRPYYDLAKDFKAELYNPDDWAKLFEKSGAKYIVLTSKHHDGYALWPSKEASKTWGFPWNAAEVGPKRDLLGDLFKAVRKTSVRAGMYYSLYEWFNPVFLNNKPAYVDQHMWPQMKELINTYQPDVFWTDGDWDLPAETWKSPQFLTWLFNESPVKDKIVVNDRWGAGLRFKHGGIYTPEYQPDLDFDNHDWEESRGMGFSYGYNREEDAWDYNTTQSLIIALIDKVSRGGNFLLDIGPDEHGKIPPIMEERLLDIGEWLKVNGDAIYNTVRWKQPVQWSEGRRDYKYKNEHATEDWKTGGDIMLKLTVDPDPGFAVKEIFYTYNPNKNNLYAIFPKYPDNNKIVLKDINLSAGTTISFLSTKKAVSWKQVGANVEVDLPPYNPNTIKSPHAYALCVEGYGKFATKPSIEAKVEKPSWKTTIEMTATPGTEIHYTTDGSEPTANSPVYSKPFSLANATVVKAKAFANGVLESTVAVLNTNQYQWKKATNLFGAKPGLRFSAYEGSMSSTKEIKDLKPVQTGISDQIDLSKITRKEQIGLVLEGYINIKQDDLVSFYLASDDGSRLYIDEDEIINHDGSHGSDEKTGAALLKKGMHKIRVEFFQGVGGIDLRLSYSTTAIKKQVVPAQVLFH
jgi:alpha-L-fucosidase